MNNITADSKLPTANNKILITGAKGQLGKKIIELMSDQYDLVLTDSDTMDITDIEAVEATIAREKPAFVIHGAAYTKVDAAEDEVDLCRKINALGTKNLAEVTAKHEIPIIYISTDYVFKGRSQDLGLRSEGLGENKFVPYTEEDQTDPQSIYGLTKFEGEEFVRKLNPDHYILRVAWLFGELPEGHPGTNFIETMLRLGKERNSLSIVNDQIGSPTYTKDLVEVLKALVNSRLSVASSSYQLPATNYKLIEPGTYHFSGSGACSWYDFAKYIFEVAEIKIELAPITSDQYPQKAKRPTWAYMSKDKIEKALEIKVRPWQEMVKEYLDKRA